MSLRDVSVTALVASISAIAVLLTMGVSLAQVRESTNYRIESDSINFGGGLSSSGSYTLESTAGEVATGESGSASYNLRAGYQQMTTTYLAMTAPADVTMSPSIPGIVGGTANGSTTVTVTTDSSAGYQVTISAGVSPAMQKGSDSIPDYTPAGANPDFTFSTDAGEAHFGYSPSGIDVASRFKDDGISSCGGGSSETELACWDGLDTVAETIVQRTSANTPNGSTTTLNFRTWIGGGVNQTAGTYVATTTLTALAL